MDKEDLKFFYRKMKDVYSFIGCQDKAPLKTEEISRQNARRSLVLSKDLKKGDSITFDHLTWKRPAYGISPREIHKVLGKKAISDFKEDSILQWNMLN
jgi:N-acetylneuraminate synthase